MTLTVDTNIPAGVELLGKTLAELQSEVEVSDEGVISGTLLYVDDFTGFSGDPAEQVGNYLTLHIDTDVAGAKITVTLINGVHGPVVLDNDRTLISRITDETTQSLRIVAEKDGYNPLVKEFALTGLTLDTEA